MNFYYEPKKIKSRDDCLDTTKYNNFIDKINNDSTLNDEDKYFLSLLATKFIVFKYNKLADYYSIAPQNIKEYLEDLKCVIVDTNRAIEKGYFKYFEEYEKLIEGVVNEK